MNLIKILPACLILNIAGSLGNISCESQSGSSSTSSDSLQISDSTAHYADLPIGDSTLRFLDSLPPATGVTNRDILLANNVSVAEFADFINDYRQNPGIIQNNRPSKKVIDSLNHRKGIAAIRQINITRMQKLSLFYFALSEPQQKLADLITRLTDTALYLTDKSKFVDSTAMPKQLGLAYSWGIKHYEQRQIPFKGDLTKDKKRPKDTCTYRIRGLDCSGFIYQLFQKNHINMIEGKADDQRRVKYLSTLLLPYFGLAQNFNVTDSGHIPRTHFKTGDIIYLRRASDTAYHIGIILKDIEKSQRLYFCEAHGGPSDCKGNLIYGPMFSELDSIPNNYRVVRITAN